MSSFTPDGIELDRYQDVVDRLIADFQASFGDDIKTTPDSVTGQIIRLIAAAIAEQNELIEGTQLQYQRGLWYQILMMSTNGRLTIR